ncbi:hypothetical protein QFZ77_003485 [Paenibacillus sp. V4I3]|nr:hypothetical protein [Paenibacillus sp. V4I3]
MNKSKELPRAAPYFFTNMWPIFRKTSDTAINNKINNQHPSLLHVTESNQLRLSDYESNFISFNLSKMIWQTGDTRSRS